MEPKKLTIRINGRVVTGLFKIALLLVAIGFAFHFFRGLQTKYIGQKVERHLDAGMPALALARIEAYRERFVADESGCALILRVYTEARKLDDLEWAVESCVYNGIETFDTLMARSQVLLNSPQPDAGIAALRSAKQYQRWHVYTRLVGALKHLRREDEALSEMAEALKTFPDVEPLHAFALQFYSETGHWQEAAKVAQLFKQLAIDGKLDKPFKALVVHVFEKAGDTATVQKIRGR